MAFGGRAMAMSTAMAMAVAMARAIAMTMAMVMANRGLALAGLGDPSGGLSGSGSFDAWPWFQGHSYGQGHIYGHGRGYGQPRAGLGKLRQKCQKPFSASYFLIFRFEVNAILKGAVLGGGKL